MIAGLDLYLDKRDKEMAASQFEGTMLFMPFHLACLANVDFFGMSTQGVLWKIKAS